MPTRNRRGAYVNFAHDRAEDWRWLEQWQPSVVRAMLHGSHSDPASVSVDKIQRIHSLVPDALILLRVWDLDDRDGRAKARMMAEPHRTAEKHVQWWRDVVERIDGVPSEQLLCGLINEPTPSRQLYDYASAALSLATPIDLRLGVGVFSVGTPGKPGESEYDMAYFSGWRRAMLDGNHVLVCHEYAQPEGMYCVWSDEHGSDRIDFESLINRHIHWPMADVPKIIGEWGVDGHLYNRHSHPEFGHSGWRDFPDLWSPERYAEEYVACCRVAHPSVYSICPFISDNADDTGVWWSFDMMPAYAALLERKHLCEIEITSHEPEKPEKPQPAPVMSSGAIDPNVALAIIDVESADSGFGDNGRLLIRFEAHIFRNELENDQLFIEHFQISYKKPWQDQQWVRLPGGGLQPIHTGNQSSEWRAFEHALSLNPNAAYRSISMGIAQVMGFNHRRIGYPTAESMFLDYSDSLTAQIMGLVNYALTDPLLLHAIKRRNWRKIAELYNGPGSIDIYAPRLESAYTARVKA